MLDRRVWNRRLDGEEVDYSPLFTYLDPQEFTMWRWTAGSPADFCIRGWDSQFLDIKETLRRYAIGWCRGETLLCRPKVGQTAVMFYRDNHHFWFHMSNKAFSAVFGIIS